MSEGALSRELRIILDRDCPGCAWPEVVAIGTEAEGPQRGECGRHPPCGWRAIVVGQFFHTVETGPVETGPKA